MIASSVYGLAELKVLNALLTSPKINHTSFNVCVLTCLLMLTGKTYLEGVRQTVYKEKLSYETHRQTTHAAIVLILLSSASYFFALLPKYRLLTSLLICSMTGYGVVFNFFVLVPYTWIQNSVGFVLGIWFIQAWSLQFTSVV